MQDLLFAFKVAKHVKSNAIVYAKKGATVGIGAGQMNRLDSSRIAARKSEDAAKAEGLESPLAIGSVVASDAFFPFADGINILIEADNCDVVGTPAIVCMEVGNIKNIITGINAWEDALGTRTVNGDSVNAILVNIKKISGYLV